MKTMPANAKGSRNTSQSGFTLVELLISMAILGVILTVTSSILQVNQKGVNAQQSRTASTGDARAAMTRISEQLAQAAYIYPSGITISVSSGIKGQGTINRVTTGSSTIAVLVADGLNSTPPKYDGVIFYVTARSNFSTDLPSLPSGTFSPNVLVRAAVETTGAGLITWAVNATPPTTWGAAAVEGVLADGIDTSRTNLMASATYSPVLGVDDTYFSSGLRGNNPAITAANALITSLGFQVAVNIAPNSASFSSSGGTVLRGLITARNVPRS